MSSLENIKPQINEATWVKTGKLEFLDATGFAFDHIIRNPSRRHLQKKLGPSRLSQIKKLRSYSRVILNPSEVDSRALIKLVEEDQAAAGINEYNDFSFGMFGVDELPAGSSPKDKAKSCSYDMQWHFDFDGLLNSESQTLVAVIFDPVKPVGFATFEIVLIHPVENETDYYQLIYVWHLVYVLPSRRGEGFGLDLSLACAKISNDLLLGLSHTLPKGSVVSPMIHADLDSVGGEIFMREIEMAVGATIARHLGEYVTILPLWD
jgi:hypothetical protein